MKRIYSDIKIPEFKKNTGKICFIGDLTGTNSDLDGEIHHGFTIGKGKTMYWYMIWHSKSGNVTVYGDKDGGGMRRRYLSGDQEITIHFK